MIIVSACLCGINCKYNGENNLDSRIVELIKKGEAILVCPEQLGGLKTPRYPAEIKGGCAKEVLLGNASVVNIVGDDVTKNYIKGAMETLKIAKLYNCSEAILKSNSPSCGFLMVYDGNFSKKLIEGNGITAQVLTDNGIKVYTERTWES